MKKIIYVSDSYQTGGTELYIFRLFKLAYGNYELYTFLLNDTKINAECDQKLREYEVKIFRIRERKGNYIYDENLNKLFGNEEVIIFSTSMRCYVAALYFSERIAKGKNVSSFLYVLHQEGALPFSYDTFMNRNNKIFCRFFVRMSKYVMIYPFRNKIMDLIRTGNIVFMDEQTYQNTKKVYKIKGDISPKIIRLGVEVYDLKTTKEKNNYSILTVSRLDFPFKGYINGLIDDFVLLKKKYKNASLTIIGDGKDHSIVSKKLNGLTDEVRNSINWVYHVEYDDLSRYFSQSKVYVGMGTTILNSSQFKVPSIVASAYQYTDYALGYFHDNPNVIGISILDQGGKTHRIIELVEKIFDMKYEEYQAISNKSYELYKNNYDINKVFKSLFDRKIGNVSAYETLKKIIIIKNILRK